MPSSEIHSITDAHVHFWSPSEELPYRWLEQIPTLNCPFLPRDLEKACETSPLQSLVFVQAGCADDRCMEEVAFVTQLAKVDPKIQGIVAFAPLEQGERASGYLTKLRENPLVKGVRRLLQDETNDFCLNPEFIKGVQSLASFGFSFDICIRAHQLPNVIEMVKLCPDVEFVLDHLGKPNVANQAFETWAKDISVLARLPNVKCKLSGLITEARPDWKIDDLKPYVLHTLNVFGVHRVMFGSDWPVMNLAGSYGQWINAVLEILKDLPKEAMRQIFSTNCKVFYKLPTPQNRYAFHAQSALPPCTTPNVSNQTPHLPAIKGT